MRCFAGRSERLLARRLLGVLFVVAVGAAVSPQLASGQQSTADSLLAARVEAVIEAASDLPADSISVAVSGGVVTLTGSVVCPDCGGTRTPSGTGTVQQSLGAVVRALPGVEQVLFELVYRRP